MTTRSFLFNWITGILITGILFSVGIAIGKLFGENIDWEGMLFSFGLVPALGLPAIVLSLPYTLIMLSAIRWGQDVKTQNPRNFLLGLHLTLTVIYLIATYVIGIADGNPWPFMAIVGGFAVVGSTLAFRPIDHDKFFRNIRNIITQ
jgi:hypothetical protein